MSPWVRIDENAMEHPKIASLSDGAFRVWMQGLAHCQKFLTDGVITAPAVRTLRFYTPKRRAELLDVRLWEDDGDGAVRVHDYLQWNDSRDAVLFARECGKRRVSLLRDPDLRNQVKERDGGRCRYCSQLVVWHDRRGPHGGTYDHVDPFAGNTAENLVVACRGCNSRKKRRTPKEAGMELLPIPGGSDSGSRSDLNPINRATCGVGVNRSVNSSSSTEGGAGETDSARAGEFCQWYEDKHDEVFRVGYMGSHNDYTTALKLVAKFTDAQLRDAALVWFGMDDDFATRGTRTVPKFASRITACLEIIKRHGLAS
jgi:5-methylcytosine-specific restriction endonuclease McrA